MASVPSFPLDHPAVLFDRTSRLRMQFTGTKAAESLTGLVTNDVLALRGGDGLYACALTAKGRVIADVRILALPPTDGTAVDSLLVDASEAGGVGFAAMIRKYVNPRLAKYADVGAGTACLTISGRDAFALVRRLGGDAEAVDAVERGAHFTHRAIMLGDVAARLVRVPDLGDAATLDLHLARDVASGITERITGAGAALADAEEWHRRRVLAFRPEWGVEMDESTLAQEANMDALQAISYRKGCYTGQETVARVHFRGHVNRTLRRVAFGDGVMPERGSALMTADAVQVGDTRSVARDDAALAVGIAMLRREVSDGAELTWSAADGSTHVATVIGAADEA